MFDITQDFAVTLTRGDTATLEISFTGDAPTAADTVVAAIKKSPGQLTAILERTLTRQEDGTYLLRIESEDTQPLPFGRYFWDLRVLYADGQVTTPFAAASFTVTQVVTDLPEAGEDP